MSKYRVKCVGCNLAVINGTPCHESGCNDITQYIDRRGKAFVSYTVWALDVWGNARDGFEVNDRHRLDSILVPIDSSDRDVVQALKAKGLLAKRLHTASFSVDEYGISASKTGEPLYQLETA